MTHTLTDPVPSSAPTATARATAFGVRGDRAPRPPAQLPPPRVPKMRGLRLVAVWAGLALGAWAAVAGLGYGLYALVQALLG